VKCLTHPEEEFDIAVLGCPFDTSVSYRPGRFATRGKANCRREIWSEGHSSGVRPTVAVSLIWTEDGHQSV